MLDPRSISDVDQWLDDLERLAATESSTVAFYRRVLNGLRRRIQAEGIAVLTQPSNGSECILVSDGTWPTPVVGEMDQAADCDATRIKRGRHWFAVPIRNNALAHGRIAAHFESVVPEEILEGQIELVRAVAEILAVRQWMRLEQFLHKDWGRFQEFLTTLSRSESKDEAAYLMVHGTGPLLQAARVSLIESHGTHHKILAVSNATEVDQNSDFAASIRREASRQTGSIDPGLRPMPAGETSASPLVSGLSPYRQTIFLSQEEAEVLAKSTRSRCAMVIEWASDDDRFDSEPLVRQFIPSLVHAWNRHVDWLAVPNMVRRWSNSQVTHGARVRKLLHWGTVALVGAGLGLLLAWPRPLMIEAQGVLQPTEQRAIFVPRDGFVQEVLVADGEKVRTDQPLLRLRSHELEQEMERVRGAMEANREKRAGISIAINQLSSVDRSSSEAIFSQTRMASELGQLDAEQKGLVAQADMLKAEQVRLTVHSPIDGVVMAHELKKYLDQRPVKRGDTLFRVVNLESPWRIELQVTDRDSGYVTAHYGDATQRTAIEFTLASLPSVHRTANVDWISPTAYRHPELGPVIDVFAATDSEGTDSQHVGAAVYAKLRCGTKALGFVWSRPFIEAVQRNFWW